MPHITDKDLEQVASRIHAQGPGASILRLVLQIAAEVLRFRRLQAEQREGTNEASKRSSYRHRDNSPDRQRRNSREQTRNRSRGRRSRSREHQERRDRRSRERGRANSMDDGITGDQSDDRSIYMMSGGAGPAGTLAAETERRHSRRRRSPLPTIPVFRPRWGLTLGFGTYLTDCINYETECRAKLARRQERWQRRDARKKAQVEGSAESESHTHGNTHPHAHEQAQSQPVAYPQDAHSQQVEDREREQAHLSPPHTLPGNQASRGSRSVSQDEYVSHQNNQAYAETQENETQAGEAPWEASAFEIEEDHYSAAGNSNPSSNRRGPQGQSQRSTVISDQSSQNRASDRSRYASSNNRYDRGTHRISSRRPPTIHVTPPGGHVQNQTQRSTTRSGSQSQHEALPARGYPTHVLPANSRRDEQELQAMTQTAPPDYRMLAGDDERE